MGNSGSIIMKIKILLAALVLALSVSAHAATRPEASRTGPGSVDRVMIGTMTWTDDLDVFKDSWTCTPRVQITGHDGKVAAQEVVASTITGHLKVTGDVTWTQTSAADWGAGSGMNVDTTTYPGSVAMNTLNISTDQAQPTYNTNAVMGAGASWRQSTKPSYSGYVEKIVISLGVHTEGDGCFDVYLASSNMSILASQTLLISSATAGTTIYFDYPFVATDTTYYIVITSITGTGAISINYSDTNPYDRGFVTTRSYGGAWGTSDVGIDIKFSVYMTASQPWYASFTSQILEADNFDIWGELTISSSIPPGSAVSFYARTSTSSSNLSTRTGIPIISGTNLAGHPGPYIQFVSTFSRTIESSVPKLDAFSLDYNVAKWLAGEEIAGDRTGYAVGVTTPTYRKEWFIDDNFDLWVATGTDNPGQWIKK
jgi:hypothetical protein